MPLTFEELPLALLAKAGDLLATTSDSMALLLGALFEALDLAGAVADDLLAGVLDLDFLRATLASSLIGA